MPLRMGESAIQADTTARNQQTVLMDSQLTLQDFDATNYESITISQKHSYSSIQ